jgi:predicted acetyltransferase
MEKFYLEIPSIDRKEEALDYLQEFIDYKSDINGSGGLNRLTKGMSYEEWLDDVINSSDEEYAKARNLVPASTYFTVRENDNKIVGMVNLRHYLNDMLRQVGGHIGYSIRPTERGKGYAKVQLYLALLECKKLGIEEAMVDCVKSNIKSEKTIIALGGVFDKEFYDQPHKRVLRNYYINVEDSIEKYKDIYGENIKKKRK